MHDNNQADVACLECGQGHLVTKTRTEEFDFDLGDETIHVLAESVPVTVCDRCGEVTSGPAAARVRHNALCKAAGFFCPDEIKVLRQRLNLSQEEFARLAGVGVATLSRWERGKLLQNRGNDNLLYLIAESETARRLLRDRNATRSQRLSTTLTTSTSAETALEVNR